MFVWGFGQQEANIFCYNTWNYTMRTWNPTKDFGGCFLKEFDINLETAIEYYEKGAFDSYMYS